MRFRASAVAALALSAAFDADAQSVVTGFVRDSGGRPIAGAEVAVDALGKRVTSDAEGRYALVEMPAGLRLIRARKVGYLPMTTLLRVDSAGTRQSHFILERSPQQLDTVVVRERTRVAGVGLAAFSERQRLGFGKFFDTTFLRKNEHRKLQHVLAELPGVRVVAPPRCNGRRDCWQPPTTMRVAVSSRLGVQCTMLVILDGIALSNGSDGSWESAFDLNTLQLSNLAAIEVYRSAAELPGEFGGARSQCGALVLWTRREP